MRFLLLWIFIFAAQVPSQSQELLVLENQLSITSQEFISDTLVVVNRSVTERWYVSSGKYDSVRVDVVQKGKKKFAEYFGWAFPLTDAGILKGVQSAPLLMVPLGIGDTSVLILSKISESHDNLISLPSPQLLSPTYVTHVNSDSLTLIAFIAGVLLALTAYNLLLFFSVKDISYLFYVIRVLAFLLFWVCLYGFGFEWVWPEFPLWNKFSLWAILGGYGMITISFSNSYLEIANIKPKLYFYTKLILGGFLAFGLMSTFSLSVFIYYNLIAPILFFPLFILSTQASKKTGFEPVKYYSFAFAAFFAGVFISLLSRFYVLPINFFTQHAVLLGVLLEALLFSLGLANRISVFKKQAEERQRKLEVKEVENRIVSDNLEEKELLLKEIHHRVKNNLQLIYSLLNLQKQHIEEPASLQAIENSQLRIKSMSLVHQKLYESDEVKEIDLSIYLHDLIDNIVDTVLEKEERQNIQMEIGRAPISIDMAVPLGLMITELIHNACKYALKSGTPGHLRVEARFHDDSYVIMICDSGKGIQGFDGQNPNFKSMGLQLVYDLVRQLKGDISYSYSSGACFNINIPAKRHGG